MIHYHISDNTITFFAKARFWTVGSDNPRFQDIRVALLTAGADEDQLVEWADVRVGFEAAGNGALQIVGNEVLFRGNPIHNVWVEKLLEFKAEGLPFDAPLAALDSLMRNPSKTARERLPIFVERNQLGFLPDGRIVGLKVVRDNFMDVYTGKFDNKPGTINKMPRDEVDDNWENECSSGFHIGAHGYLPKFGLYDSSRRVVLCSFHAEHAVAVPKDYDGTKLRVCEYEVMSEIDKDYIEAYLATHQTLIDDYIDANATGEYDPD